MTIFGWILLIILALIILILSITLIRVAKNAGYFTKKDRELIKFVIDMYVEYGEEIGITSEDKHDVIVKNLNDLKEKIK